MLIPPEGIARAWFLAAPHLQKAVRLQRKVKLREVYEMVREESAQLWVVWDTEQSGVVAAFVTGIEVWPDWRVARVSLLGGERMAEWKHLMPELEQWARCNGCNELELAGRKGWGRVFPDYEPSAYLYSKEL